MHPVQPEPEPTDCTLRGALGNYGRVPHEAAGGSTTPGGNAVHPPSSWARMAATVAAPAPAPARAVQQQTHYRSKAQFMEMEWGDRNCTLPQAQQAWKRWKDLNKHPSRCNDFKGKKGCGQITYWGGGRCSNPACGQYQP